MKKHLDCLSSLHYMHILYLPTLNVAFKCLGEIYAHLVTSKYLKVFVKVRLHGSDYYSIVSTGGAQGLIIIELPGSSAVFNHIKSYSADFFLLFHLPCDQWLYMKTVIQLKTIKFKGETEELHSPLIHCQICLFFMDENEGWVSGMSFGFYFLNIQGSVHCYLVWYIW